MNRKPLKRTPFKSHKHRTTEATEIKPGTKDIVWERDRRCCVWCQKPVDKFFANAHFMRRSQLGMGIEQNILTLCQEDHNRFDQGKPAERRAMREFFRLYLATYYADWGWTEEKVKYWRDT